MYTQGQGTAPDGYCFVFGPLTLCRWSILFGCPLPTTWHDGLGSRVIPTKLSPTFTDF